MQNFGGIQQNMTYMMQQMGTGQEFPVPITAAQNVPIQQRKQRNNKKFLAPQTLPQQQQQLRMLQQPQQLQQFQPQPPPPQQPPPQIQQIESMGQIAPGSIVPNTIGQQRKNPPMRQIPQVVKGQPPQPPQIKIDRDTYFLLSENLCSFSWMDSVESDWIGDKINPEIVQIIDNADDTETDLDFNSITDYINVSNNLFQQK